MTTGIGKLTARNIMTRHVATIRAKEKVHDALLLLAENRLSALPVVDPDGICVGILSQTDLIAITREADAEDDVRNSQRSMADFVFAGIPLEDITNETVEDVMSDRVVCVGPDDTIAEIADKMVRYEIHHVPVCNAEGQLLGIISAMDILSSVRTILGQQA